MTGARTVVRRNGSRAFGKRRRAGGAGRRRGAAEEKLSPSNRIMPVVKVVFLHRWRRSARDEGVVRRTTEESGDGVPLSVSGGGGRAGIIQTYCRNGDCCSDVEKGQVTGNHEIGWCQLMAISFQNFTYEESSNSISSLIIREDDLRYSAPAFPSLQCRGRPLPLFFQ